MITPPPARARDHHPQTPLLLPLQPLQQLARKALCPTSPLQALVRGIPKRAILRDNKLAIGQRQPEGSV